MSIIRCEGSKSKCAHDVDMDYEDTGEIKGKIYCLECFAEHKDKPVIERYAIRRAGGKK